MTGSLPNAATKPKVFVKIPEDEALVSIIHDTVDQVLKNGPEFERVLEHREKYNTQYAFLWDHTVTFVIFLPVTVFRTCLLQMESLFAITWRLSVLLED